MTVKLRYKEPDEHESKLLTQGLLDNEKSIENASDNLRFASSVAELGLLLCNSLYKGSSSYDSVQSLAEDARGSDSKGYRSDFLKLADKAKYLRK